MAAVKTPWSLLQTEQPQLSQPDICRFNCLRREEKKFTKLTVITKKKRGECGRDPSPGWKGMVPHVLYMKYFH